MPQSPSAKTFFGTQCVEKIRDSGLTVKEVAAKIKNTPDSQFSRWKKGEWTYIPPEKIVDIVKTICPKDPREQVDLITAYLTDMTPIEFRPYILIGQRDEDEGKAKKLKPMGGVGSGWSEEMRQRLDAVAEAYGMDDDFAAMVDNLVRWGKRLQKERANAASNSAR